MYFYQNKSISFSNTAEKEAEIKKDIDKFIL